MLTIVYLHLYTDFPGNHIVVGLLREYPQNPYQAHLESILIVFPGLFLL